MFPNGLPMEIVLLVLVILSILLQLALRSGENDKNLGRIERKLDAIIKHMCIEIPNGLQILSEETRRIAEDPSRKIEAIKRLREETGMGLREAKDLIEEYQRSKGVA